MFKKNKKIGKRSQLFTKKVWSTSERKASLVYKYTKSVYYTIVHKISLLKQCTKNEITVQVYTNPVYYASIHKTSLLSGHKTSLLFCVRDRDRQTDFNINNERNVQGRNITKVHKLVM